MSDSVKKYFELKQEGKIFESPDRGKTIYRRGLGEPHEARQLYSKQLEQAMEQEKYNPEWLETFAKLARRFPHARTAFLVDLTDNEFWEEKR